MERHKIYLNRKSMKVVKRDVSKTAGQYAGSASNINISGGSGGTALADKWFYMDASTGVVHCRYHFAGDGEVSAFADVSLGPSAMYAQMKDTLATIDSSSSLQDVISVLTELKEIL